MKKYLALFLIAMCVLSLVSCGKQPQVVTSETYIDDENDFEDGSNVNSEIENDEQKDKDTTSSREDKTSSKQDKTSSTKPAGINLTFGGVSYENFCVVCDDTTDPVLFEASKKIVNAIYEITGKKLDISESSKTDNCFFLYVGGTSDGLPNKYSIYFEDGDITFEGDCSKAVDAAVNKFITQFKGTKKDKDIPSTYSEKGEIKFMNIPYTSDKLRYVGRWEETKDGIESRWNYSSVEICFTGSTLIAEVDAKTALGSSASNPHVLVTVDGGEEQSIKPNKGTIKLDMGSNGKHTVKIAGNVNYAVTLKSFYLPDGETLTKPADKTNIMFIGDSISHGTSCYSFLVGNILGWNWSVVAQAGMSLQDGHGWYFRNANFTAGIPEVGMETCFFKNESAAYTKTLTDSDFKYTSAPDVVVIYLGTNDYTEATDKSAVSKFTSSYSNFIGKIRAKYPDCKIYMVESISTKKDTRERVTKIVNMAYDSISKKFKNISIINSSAWDIEAGDEIHPSVAGSAEFAKKVAEVIKKDYK